mgnify:CR=1 FL=1|tara:strand:- start:7 stop:324 length:318 start_codon:yes stop_codon:yes gene_type:complete
MPKGQSTFEYNEVTNSVTDSKSFSRSGVYFINIVNNTAFEVQLISRSTGEIRIPANTNMEFFGHPLAPAQISYKVRFNAAAPTTDFISIISSSVNNLNDGFFKQC